MDGPGAPATDEEAVARISRRRVARSTSRAVTSALRKWHATLASHAKRVYRYFLSSEALLTATAIAEAAPILARMDNSLRGLTDPAEAVVEGIAHTLERLPS